MNVDGCAEHTLDCWVGAVGGRREGGRNELFFHPAPLVAGGQEDIESLKQRQVPASRGGLPLITGSLQHSANSPGPIKMSFKGFPTCIF